MAGVTVKEIKDYKWPDTDQDTDHEWSEHMGVFLKMREIGKRWNGDNLTI